ncbi:hypothetical protein [Bradyrhizobium liaoningense]|uniref:hypothetical protein n=1 Tax=Bradyrhizobium liaoningense TaxID=43992 RepID=UPI001BADD1EF|nr:hypothetical protein [Bradyrhizobium liaoningense]MBR1170180.1 hypothetical protein [Bradyrhizobium liaoningense]
MRWATVSIAATREPPALAPGVTSSSSLHRNSGLVLIVDAAALALQRDRTFSLPTSGLLESKALPAQISAQEWGADKMFDELFPGTQITLQITSETMADLAGLADRLNETTRPIAGLVVPDARGIAGGASQMSSAPNEAHRPP